jgi:hypothetical protein
MTAQDAGVGSAAVVVIGAVAAAGLLDPAPAEHSTPGQVTMAP